ncbi:MAG: hypothetical protein ACLRZ9_00635 [Eubacterium sp.]
MKINRKKIFFIMVLLGYIMLFSNNTKVYAKDVGVKTPENVVITRYKNKSLKIKWKKVENADGYRIYRYSRKNKKFVRVKTIYGNNKTTWINDNLKFHKIYKYQVNAFKIKKGKKIFSKKSYWVSARTYGKKGKVVNAESVNAEFQGIDTDHNYYEMSICSSGQMYALIDPDDYVKNDKARIISKNIRWSSSDKTILKVNSSGQITTTDQEGECYVYLRAHNGKTTKVKIKVINYARPDSFPYYEGSSVYINELLMNYRTEVCDIATYFTKYCKKGMGGVIKITEDGNITGMPDFDNISVVEKEIEKLLKQFPLVMRINYYEDGVMFRMNYDVYGNSYIEVTYSKSNDFEDSPLKIAPHWIAKQFSPM